MAKARKVNRPFVRLLKTLGITADEEMISARTTRGTRLVRVIGQSVTFEEFSNACLKIIFAIAMTILSDWVKNPCKFFNQ